MATIRIERLTVDTIIGEYEWERDLPQRLSVNIEFETDIRDAAAHDDLTQTVDYDKLTRQILEHAKQTEYRLIEALAVDLLRRVMDYPGVDKARVSVAKPGALKDAELVYVEVDSDTDLQPE